MGRSNPKWLDQSFARAVLRSEIRSAYMSLRRLRRTFCDACRLGSALRTNTIVSLLEHLPERSIPPCAVEQFRSFVGRPDNRGPIFSLLGSAWVE